MQSDHKRFAVPKSTSGAKLTLLGIDYRTAPIAVRESVRFDDRSILSLLSDFADEYPDIELLVLSTCNRTEFYLSSDRQINASQSLLTVLKRIRPDASVFHSNCYLYQKNETDAASHLFKVACGIDSSILGDGQILGQVKIAMKTASLTSTIGPHLHQLFKQTMRVAKRVRKETKIGFGNAGLGSSITAFVNSLEKEFNEPTRILIIGAGEIAREIGRNLAKDSNREIVFINRNREKAELLAAHCGGSTEN